MFLRKSTIQTSIVFSIQLQIIFCHCSYAADFSKAQKTFVPETQIVRNNNRRVDFESIHEQNSKISKNKTNISSNSNKSNIAKTDKLEKAEKLSNAKKTIISDTNKNNKLLKINPSDINSDEALNLLSKHFKQGVSPKLIARMKDTAKDLQNSGRLEEAQRVLARIKDMDPEDKAAAKELASIGVRRSKQYLASKDFRNAISSARHALATDPDSIEAQKLLSHLHQKLGSNPTDHKAHTTVANALASKQAYSEAAVEYNSSLKLQSNPAAHIGLGKIAEQTHGPGAGRKHFEQAIILDPNHSEAHRELGLSYLASNNLASANSELSRALILNPNDQTASNHLLRLWQNQVSRAPSANSHLGLARAYQLSGQLENAQAEYKEVVRMEPNHPYLPAARQSFKYALAKKEAKNNIAAAQTYESQGNIVAAIQKAGESVSLSPGDNTYKIYYGDLLQKAGYLANAQEVYAHVLKSEPQNTLASDRLNSLNKLGLNPNQSQLPTNNNPNLLSNLNQFPGNKLASLSYPPNAGPYVNSAAGVPVDHVGQLSNFIGQIRDHMLLQKQATEKYEDATQQALKEITNTQQGNLTASSATGINQPGISTTTASGLVAPMSMSTMSSNNDYIDKILASPLGSPLPSQSTSAQATPNIDTGLPLPGQSHLRGPIPSTASVAATDGLRGPVVSLNPSQQALKFELKQIKQSKSGIQLKVSLRNDSGESIILPEKVQALARYNNNSESPLNISFDSKKIPAHSSLSGLIKLGNNNLDPSADIILKNINPNNSEIHLVTAISAK